MLHSIKTRHHQGLIAFFLAALDVVLAAAFLVLVICSTLAMVMLSNIVSDAFGAAPVLNLTQTLELMKTGTWQDSLWIYLLLFSTLVPTAIHFVVASLALVFWLPLNRLNKYADVMQSTLDKYEKKDAKKVIVLDSDVRLMAVTYRIMTPVVAVTASGLLLTYAGLSLANYMPIWIQWALGSFAN